MPRRLTAAILILLAVQVAGPANAGVINPDISVLGQPFMRWTNDASNPSAKRATLDEGEVEMVYDSYLKAVGSLRSYHYQEVECA